MTSDQREPNVSALPDPRRAFGMWHPVAEGDVGNQDKLEEICGDVGWKVISTALAEGWQPLHGAWPKVWLWPDFQPEGAPEPIAAMCAEVVVIPLN